MVNPVVEEPVVKLKELVGRYGVDMGIDRVANNAVVQKAYSRVRLNGNLVNLVDIFSPEVVCGRCAPGVRVFYKAGIEGKCGIGYQWLDKAQAVSY